MPQPSSVQPFAAARPSTLSLMSAMIAQAPSASPTISDIVLARWCCARPNSSSAPAVMLKKPVQPLTSIPSQDVPCGLPLGKFAPAFGKVEFFSRPVSP